MVFFSGAFFFLFVLALIFVPMGFWLYALVEVLRAPEQAFGPPWDNGKTPWTIGLVVGLMLPMGALVAAILWWVQGHKALRAGQLVPKPFWSPSRGGYPPAAYPQYPSPPEHTGQHLPR